MGFFFGDLALKQHLLQISAEGTVKMFCLT